MDFTVPPKQQHEDDRVGYKRPPRDKRFKLGHSVNPRGRPRGVRSVAELMSRELDGRIQVTENGRRRSITRREAVTKRIIGEALAGKAKAIDVLLGLDREAAEIVRQVTGVLARPADDETKAGLLRRLRAAVASESADRDPS